MHETVKMVALYAVLSIASAAAQTVTGSGTANSVPKFSGSTILTNSAITEVNGDVGIGTSTPHSTLDVNGGIQASGFNTGVVAMTLGNALANAGNKGWGIRANADTYPWNGVADSLGFEYWDGPNPIFPVTLTSSGNVGIGTTTPSSPLSLGHTSSFNLNTTGSDNVLSSITFQNYFLGGAQYTNASISAVQPVGSYADAGALVFSTAFGGQVERMRILPQGQVGIGTKTPSATLEVNGNVKLTSGSGSSITFADNTVQSTAWSGTLCGGDYAESVDVSGERTQYEPGDVLVIDPSQPGSFLKSSKSYSRLVAGIYSTKPGLIGRRQSTDPKLSSTEVPMAMVGIVPTKVTAENGPIEVGDLLVSSSLPAHAMKGGDGALPTGTVIGKALGSLASGTGIIEVLVSLQ